MRLQHMKVTRHAGVMCAACLVFLVVAGAGVFTGLSPQATAGAAPPDGAQLFRTYCASCHGTTVTGGGAAAIAI